jgi:hypothetical protein
MEENAKKPRAGNSYWQSDVRIARGTVRCIVYLYPDAVAKALADQTSSMSMQQKIIGQPIPADMQEKYLAALCAKDAVALFSHEPVDILPTPVKPVDRAPEGREAWAWWHKA